MSEIEGLKLPYGAKGLEVGDFVVEFSKDKIIALLKGNDEHYTVGQVDSSEY